MPLDEKLQEHLNDLEIKRLKQIEHLRSLNKKEQKEYISTMVARYIYANCEHGVEEIPFAWFSKEYNELDNDLLEELFIHAQTIFALYKIIKNDRFLVFYGRTGENHTDKVQLVMDKSHPKYLKTFKALNRLNEYVYVKYGLSLSRQRIEHDTYCNMTSSEGLENHTKVGIEYISHVLNTKDLLNLNKSIDPKIEEYMRSIYEGEGCIV
ncbi:MAG: hypothetical protein PHW18_12610 [Sulfuricurvum sp.]|uniref:hypothetical protein n=1 Tax=Sulfuricurvum sp. TaxID=2025608 RepID=UPI002634EE80|nr:hypothetical protein [Sulfuricurvum sp.]MDD2830409.1 hypothetical protein [Sulfuricurvum sp.]MDD4948872.1 hypothetical protein [Sulfuricurvum sp.]